jgi:hypothetical protein
MRTEFQKTRVRFDRTKGILQREPFVVPFSGRVEQAQAFLTGFTAYFDNDDHNLRRLQVEVDVTDINRSVVEGIARLGLRDSNGYDDPYSGWIELVVVAQVA